MRIRISIPAQTLELHDDSGCLLRRYAISTAKNGAGELNGSFRTPRGAHLIRAKIGAGLPANTVFKRRRPTGEVWSPQLAEAFPGRDWILTRILWLSGLELGFNRLGQVDTMRRYVYIHGSPETVSMGEPGSIGCVRMRNSDVTELFDQVPVRTRVDIVEFSLTEGNWAAMKAAASPIREQVFVHEQHVPQSMEWDEHDAGSCHVLARGPDGAPIGTGRLLPDGQIGRMAVLPEWRGRGVGRALLQRLLEVAGNAGMSCLMLHAQMHALPFYEGFGFSGSGEVFMEAGIPHLMMQRMLNGQNQSLQLRRT
jgi:predicted GNAT family N-acyltransferase